MPSMRGDRVLFQTDGLLSAGAPAQQAVLVYDTADDQDKVRLPAAARALRIAGLHKEGNVKASLTPDVGTKVAIQRLGEGRVLLAAKNGGGAKSVLPGDWAVVHNTSGHTSAYVLGSGTAMLLGQFRTKYTNNEASAAVPVELEQIPQLMIQAEVIRAREDAIGVNNTRDLTPGGTAFNGDYSLFVAPWDGTLRGFRLDVEPGVGPAGIINATVWIKPPGGAWAAAQIGGANWTLALNCASATSAEDPIDTDALASSKSLAILKGTKVAIQRITDNNIANVSQLQGRVIFY